MNNNGKFNNGSDPLIMHNQYPPWMEQPYMNQTTQYYQLQNLTSNFLDSNNPKRLMQSSKSIKRKQDNLTCDICGVEVNSQQMMDSHILGQKHMKKMKLKTIESANHTSDNIDVKQKPVVESDSKLESNQSSTIVKPSTSSDKRSASQLMNELAKFNKVTAKYDVIKETGPPHRKQFEVQLTIADEIYTGTGTSIKRAQQIAAEQALATTALKKPEQKQRTLNSTRMIPTRKIPADDSQQYTLSSTSQQQQQQQIDPINDNTFEMFLNKKHTDIIEYDSTIIAVNHFVENIERAMKYVSDKMMAEYQQKNIRVVPKLLDNIQSNNIEQINEDSSESFRYTRTKYIYGAGQPGRRPH
ncbi:unnamed protein product [Rotaria sp. Silwood2]|nr:unnamed protein product [Rotaria sp. Silwood2]